MPYWPYDSVIGILVLHQLIFPHPLRRPSHLRKFPTTPRKSINKGLADAQKVASKADLGYLVLTTPSDLKHWRGLHLCSWLDLWDRMGMEPQRKRLLDQKGGSLAGQPLYVDKARSAWRATRSRCLGCPLHRSHRGRGHAKRSALEHTSRDASLF